MTCNYYCWIETVIQYIDEAGLKQSIIEGGEPRQRHVNEKYDSDFETSYGLNEEIEDYGKKVLYTNKVWYCLPRGKLRIQGICYSKKIPFDMIVDVFKFKNGYYC